MSETGTNAKPRRPTREDIEDVIKRVEIHTEDVESSSGIIFAVADLHTLAQAARWALELVDFDNPPLSAEELAALRRPPKKKTTPRSLGDLRMMRAARKNRRK